MRYIQFLIYLFAAVSAHAQSGIADAAVLEQVQAADGYVREVRRHLHLHPETGGHEHATVQYLKQQLRAIGGFELHDVAGSTGFYAILDTHRPGKTIGLRTDIDGLPIEESATNGGGQSKPYLSENHGVTQGCGHDGHMAIILGTARILHHFLPQLSGRFVLIFEEGEETNTGIRPMIAALSSLKLDAIYGNHVSVAVPAGKLFVQEGPIMAGMATLALHVNGRGGHASRPDQAVSPVPAAADIVLALGQAWQNQRDITQTVTLGIAQLQGGTAYNVIPSSVFVGGTMRFFNEAQGELALQVVRRVAENTAAAHRCTVSYDSVMQVNLPPVVNDTIETRFARSVIERIYPGRTVTGQDYIWYASETFALYSQLAPTVFVHVGIANPERGITAAHHTDAFDLDDYALQYGVGAMAQYAIQAVSTAAQNSTSYLLTPFPALQQTTDYTCGPVSALMVQQYYGDDSETELSLAEKVGCHVDDSRPDAPVGSAWRFTDYGTNVMELHDYFSRREDYRIVASSIDASSARPLLTDTLKFSVHMQGNIAPSFADYSAAARFFGEQLRAGRPVMVCWAAWGGHWGVVIGIDDNATPDYFDDDIITLADPYDSFDGQCDSRVAVPLPLFFYDWYCTMTPRPYQLQPYLVVEPQQ